MHETETNEFKDRVTINAVLAFTAYGLVWTPIVMQMCRKYRMKLSH